MEIIPMAIPPKVGMAMGIMISEPRPVDVRIGMRAMSVVAVVIRQGRTRFRAPLMVVRRISSTLVGLSSAKD